MKIVDFIQVTDFPLLIPLIERFAKDTDTPFHQHINEVSASLMNDNILTIVGKNDEDGKGIVAYLCGSYLNKYEFMISQFYSKDSQITQVIGNFLDTHLINNGVKRILILSKQKPRTFEKYGFKVERYAMIKTLKEKE